MIVISENLHSEYAGEEKQCAIAYMVGADIDELFIDITYISENGKEKFRNSQTFIFKDENLEKFLEVIEKTKKVKALFRKGGT